MTTQQELAIVSPESTMASPQAEENRRPSHPLADLRHAAMSVPIERITELLGDYMGRRTAFREWLVQQLVQGIHYGVAPGCEPRGEVNPLQWRHKPSLYKAGAEFICDLMNVRGKYAADMAASQQLGEEQPGNKQIAPRYFVYKCELISRSTKEVLGEGTGARQLGQKGGDVNNSVKMAQKNALVAAVINVYSLSDLFTQDREPDEFANPEVEPNAPKTAPRAERAEKTAIAGATIKAELNRWKGLQHPEDLSMENWVRWVEKATNCNVDFSKTSAWTQAHIMTVRVALDREEGK